MLLGRLMLPELIPGLLVDFHLIELAPVLFEYFLVLGRHLLFGPETRSADADTNLQ